MATPQRRPSQDSPANVGDQIESLVVGRLGRRLTQGSAGPSRPLLSFHAFLTSSAYCNLELSPLMASIALASEGLPVPIADEDSAAHFGCAVAGLPTTRRRTVCVRAGGRAGKTSRLLAPKALHSAITVPLPTVRTGESAVALIVAPDMKLAAQTLSFVKGYVDDSPVLSAMLVGDPTKTEVNLLRPDGKVVRVEILAATRGARAVRARTLVGAFMDEACLFYDEDSGVVNDSELYRALHQRVVPGGQTWIVSTPWIARSGLLEQMLGADWGKHRHALCVTSGTRALNPTWDPDGEIESDLRAQDPLAAQREIDGIPLNGSAASFFDPKSIDDAVDRNLILPRVAAPGEELTAGADFGFQSDACAMAVVHRDSERYYVADLLEKIPGEEALKPSVIVKEFAERMLAHSGLSHVVADGHYRESISEHLNEQGLSLYDAPAGNLGVSEVYIKARGLFREGKVKLPDHPRLLKQLRAIGWVPNPGGSISINKPREKRKLGADGTMGGGHCDLADAVVLALWEACGLAVPEPAPKPGTVAFYEQEQNKAWAQVEARLTEKQKEWWDA